MSKLAERWTSMWEWAKGHRAEMIQSIAIPEVHVTNSGEIAVNIEPGNHYFAVFVNELFLTHSRKWSVLIDPMAVIVCEFTYDKEPKIVPFVVGPSLLSGKVEKVPNGMAFTDTQVAGVCPYVGGKLAVTVILCEVTRDSLPRKLLSIVEKTADSFPFGSALNSHLKIADAVLDGVEALFELGGARPLVGHRWEYNDSFTQWLKPGFFVMIRDFPANFDTSSLRVERGRLYNQGRDGTQPYRQSDYVLYSLRMVENRKDYTELPFYRVIEEALRSASSSDSGAWQRAKAGLLTAYQEMITSPDLTWKQAQDLSELFKDKLRVAKRHADSFGTLSGETSPPSISAEIAQSIEGLSHASERTEHLLNIHKVMEL